MNKTPLRRRANGTSVPASFHPHPQQAIQLLSIIADDDQVIAESPTRVVEALQNHGHLLCDEAVDALRDWLEATLST